MNEEKLKPIVFIKGKYNFHRNNLFQQNLLLKALQQTTNIDELRRLIGVQKKVDVYRTLDKLALRKEYHQALVKMGIDFDTIVAGIRQVAETGEKDSDRLAAWKVFLRSLGLDEYKEESAESKKTWEDLIRDISEKETIEGNKEDTKLLEYEVNEPIIPEEVKEERKKEEEIGRSIYE
jgi:hypothetical protein